MRTNTVPKERSILQYGFHKKWNILLRGTNRIEAEEAEAASRMQEQEDEQEEEEHLRIDNEAAEAARLLKQQKEEERLQILEAEATETV